MTTPYQPRKLSAPEPNPGDAPYFAAATEGKLLVKRCADCGEYHWYPRAVCPFCLSGHTEWVPASGRGTIYTYSVTRRADPIPYAIAFVTLEEGVTMMTNLVDCDLDALQIGQAAQVTFKDTENGQPVPCFVPA